MLIDFSNYTTSKTQDVLISQRILKGEKELFVLLLKPYNTALHHIVRSLITSESLIQKALLICYEAAFKQLEYFHGQCHFKIWLTLVGMREVQNLATESKLDAPSIDHSATIIGSLPKNAQIVFVLKKILNLKDKEISSCCGLSLIEIEKYDELSRRILQNNYDIISLYNSSVVYDYDFLITQFVRQQITHPSAICGVCNSNVTEPIDNKIEMQMHDKKIDTMLQLKHEHSENLTLCTNIRTGFIKGVETHRIKSYTDWYWNNFLLTHFSTEEKNIFPILGDRSPFVKKAISQHKRLRKLFESKDDIHKKLNRIEEELAAHVRFEERVLFKEIEKLGNANDIKTIEGSHEDPLDNLIWKDKFWA